jgi:hypothetical protein
VKLIAIRLNTWATTWWESLKISQERQGKLGISNWDMMKEHFVPFSYA